MDVKDKILRDSLISYWGSKYRRVYLSEDRKIEYWGYSRVRFIPIGQYVYNLLLSGDMSRGSFMLLNYMLMRVKYGYDPLESGGCFLSYKINYFKEKFGNRSFYRFKKELIDLDLIINISSNYYVFNDKFINKIRNKKNRVL